MKFTVPLVPPSVNHYKMPRRGGRGYYLTPEAIAFKVAVGVYGRSATTYHCATAIQIRIFLGKGQKGDIDNFAKVVLDGIKEAGLISTDARVEDLRLQKFRDEANPRTEIEVKAI